MNACQWFKETNASGSFHVVFERQNSLEEKINHVSSKLSILRLDFLHAQSNLTESESEVLEKRIRSLESDLSNLRLELQKPQTKLRKLDKNSLEEGINLLEWQYGTPAYLAASVVGYSRVEADKHFVSDVIAGAAIANVVAFFLVDSIDEDVVIIPVFNSRKPNFGILAHFKF